MKDLKFRQSPHEEYVLHNEHMLILIYVNDLLLFSTEDRLKQVSYNLAKKLKLTGHPISSKVDFLGCNISRCSSTGNYNLSQTEYVKKMTAILQLKPQAILLPFNPVTSEDKTSRVTQEYNYRLNGGSSDISFLQTRSVELNPSTC